MRVFLTGGSGFVGPAVLHELLRHGHEVLALARSDTSAQQLAACGADVHRGDLTDLAGLRRATERVDAVVHLALADGPGLAESLEVERVALGLMAQTLAPHGGPLVFASATSFLSPGRIVTEEDSGVPDAPVPRAAVEDEVLQLSEGGARVVAVRLPTLVHGPRDRRGFITRLIDTARDTGRSAYVGDGANRWPAVHRLDAATVFRLALEKAAPGSRVHAVAEPGIPFRDLADAIAAQVGVPSVSIRPDQAVGAFPRLPGPLAALTATDIPAANTITRHLLDWAPAQAGVLQDIATGTYTSLPGRGATQPRSVP